jgi:hypothetical protein
MLKKDRKYNVGYVVNMDTLQGNAQREKLQEILKGKYLNKGPENHNQMMS